MSTASVGACDDPTDGVDHSGRTGKSILRSLLLTAVDANGYELRQTDGYVATTCLTWQVIAMRFVDLVHLIGDEPLFRSALLLSGSTSSARIRLQLSRWVKTGQLIQLRRGL